MRKTTAPKLRLNRETLAGLEGATGGAVVISGGNTTCALHSCLNQCPVFPLTHACPTGLSCGEIC